ncbi:hypothetical protein SM907_24515 (plasmid) [Klebsiella aerogenes]|uniref:hypothetical protein n=1 Tax=Klebsiella aerogenes TaxID=548 RepID=UPI002A81E14D|nr:hypothetical protein [Klebsiella aerogenes]WPS11032.1 hypothetical protein SM907_24515 [Klebsiella aerogenes]
MMNTFADPGHVAAETEAALKCWIRTECILYRRIYEAWYCRLGEMAFDSSRLEVRSWTALLDMHMLAVCGPVATVFRYLCRSYRSGNASALVFLDSRLRLPGRSHSHDELVMVSAPR